MTDPHAPLRADIHLLGDLLGERLRMSEGDDLFETVERVRALSKGAHEPGAAGDEAFAALARVLAELPVSRALPVARAFSHFLTLANIAEQHHRIRRRRDYQRDRASRPQPGSFDDTFARLLASGVAPERLHDAIVSMSVELVFTAHPTEIMRRTLVQAYARIAELLAEHDRGDLTAPERAAIDRALREEVAVIWGTDEVRESKPTPLDEVRWGLAVFERTLWDAVPAAYRALDAALRGHTGRALAIGTVPIRFGSWIGGDRDGNPSVTPEVTRRATLMARWVAADLFAKDVDRLVGELSFERGSARLHERAGAAREPYRALLRDVRARLRLTRARLEEALESGAPRIDEPIATRELQEALALCHASLLDTRNDVVAEGRLADVMRRAAVFGLALVPLDLRDEADKYAAAVDARSGGEYARLDEDGRQRWLLARLTEPVHRGADAASRERAGARAEPVLEMFRVAASLHRDSLGACVITMASTPSDVLAAEFLQQAAGITPPMRVVPLFETAADLHRAPATLRALLAIPWYRSRVDANGGRQEVMIGYSDSSKDAGRFAAAWDLYRAQEEIVEACRASNVRLTLFHGRGGSVGRGGGPTYLAIQSQPPGSIDGTLRVTEQGEMLQAKFGLTGIAVRTLEVYVSAMLEATLVAHAGASRAFRDEIDRLAEASRAAFRDRIDDAEFIEYFREATPERELELTNIGSRPARRQTGSDPGSGRTDPPLRRLRAIPWQFAWTQTRLLLASWLGVDAAFDGLDAAAAGDARRELWRRMYREWPFFRSTIDLIEMVLAKADGRIAAEYDRRLVAPARRAIGEDFRRRLERAMAVVLEVTGHRELLEENQVLRRSIDVRNPYVDPINLVQIELLKRLRAKGREPSALPRTSRKDPPDPDLLEEAFVVTVNGIAAGMRNTG